MTSSSSLPHIIRRAHFKIQFVPRFAELTELDSWKLFQNRRNWLAWKRDEISYNPSENLLDLYIYDKDASTVRVQLPVGLQKCVIAYSLRITPLTNRSWIPWFGIYTSVERKGISVTADYFYHDFYGIYMEEFARVDGRMPVLLEASYHTFGLIHPGVQVGRRVVLPDTLGLPPFNSHFARRFARFASKGDQVKLKLVNPVKWTGECSIVALAATSLFWQAMLRHQSARNVNNNNDNNQVLLTLNGPYNCTVMQALLGTILGKPTLLELNFEQVLCLVDLADMFMMDQLRRCAARELMRFLDSGTASCIAKMVLVHRLDRQVYQKAIEILERKD